jgi:aminoglycoside phosphotransferase (APT) family kinase protein
MFYIMEFLDGRIFEDQNLPGVSLEEKRELWRAAIQTLAELHSVDPREVGLENFGKAAGFYNRQIRTWESIIKSQEGILSVDTQQPVGKVPHFEESLRYFKDQRLQPKEKMSLVHGDYKLDNLVFHKTEPRVIGILE